MALITVGFKSKALNHNTKINVIIPSTAPTEDIPTVYLLHGMTGGYDSWIRKSSLESYAEKLGVAMVCADGENSFYNDMKYGKDYFTYVSEELVEYTRRIFKLSHKREKTFICGYSMGGYGAYRTALLKPHQYGAAASLSGCIDIVSRLQVCRWRREATAIWGDDFMDTVKGTNADLYWLVDTFPEDAPRPRLYSACGRSDSLFDMNVEFSEYVKKDGRFDFEFEEGDGAHDWNFWDPWLYRALCKMLDRAGEV